MFFSCSKGASHVKVSDRCIDLRATDTRYWILGSIGKNVRWLLVSEQLEFTVERRTDGDGRDDHHLLGKVDCDEEAFPSAWPSVGEQKASSTRTPTDHPTLRPAERTGGAGGGGKAALPYGCVYGMSAGLRHAETSICCPWSRQHSPWLHARLQKTMLPPRSSPGLARAVLRTSTSHLHTAFQKGIEIWIYLNIYVEYT